MRDNHIYSILDISLNGDHILSFRDFKDHGRARSIWHYKGKFYQINFGLKEYDVAEYFEIDPDIVNQICALLGDKQITFEF